MGDTVDTAVAVMADLLMPNPKPRLKPLLLLKLMPKLMPMLTMAMADTVDTDTAVDTEDVADTVMAVAITARDLPNPKLTATVMAVDTVTAVVMVDTVDTADTTDKLLEDQVTRIQIKIHS